MPRGGDAAAVRAAAAELGVTFTIVANASVQGGERLPGDSPLHAL
ncbi:MAG: hypothetical protein ACK6CT_01955 [Planctomycetia bacterium]